MIETESIIITLKKNTKIKLIYKKKNIPTNQNKQLLVTNNTNMICDSSLSQIEVAIDSLNIVCRNDLMASSIIQIPQIIERGGK
jgi:hypothetical protein